MTEFTIVNPNKMRVKLEMGVVDLPKIKKQLIQWGNQFEHIVWLDSNSYLEIDRTYEAVLAVDAHKVFQSDSKEALEDLKEYRKANKDWLFGYLSFNAADKTSVKNKESKLPKYPKLHFFHPKKIFLLKQNSIEIHYASICEEEIEADWNTINNIKVEDYEREALHLPIQAKLSKQAYLEKINKIQDYIRQGKITEINFCQEFYAHAELKNPLAIYQHLNAISSTPFASYVRMEEDYILCASPERYLSNTAGLIKAQPIKGTAKRKENTLEDRKIRLGLETNEKEIAENVLITEMLVEEFYEIAEEESVQITELCKAYSFKQVHQLISTIVCHLKPELSEVDAIKATYPMGSMTGIPKDITLKIIEELENFDRGLYSGSVGYFAPNGDFDFNVVIRSILYNAKSKYVSFAAGGAITALSDPEEEYQETMLKVKAMEEVLGAVEEK